MKPSNIIYYNEYSGLAELCTAEDLNRVQALTVYGRSYSTAKLAATLLADKKAICTKRLCSDDSSAAKLTGTFTLTEKAAGRLCIDFSEGTAHKAPVLVGSIRFLKQNGLIINGVTGKAAIIVNPGQNNARPTDALEQFALNIGLYLLATLDGDWERTRHSLNTRLSPAQAKIKRLQEALDACTQERDACQLRIIGLEHKLTAVISAMNKTIREQAAELTSLRTTNKHYASIANSQHSSKQAPHKMAMPPKAFDYIGMLQNILSGDKFCIVGGNEAWQHKLLLALPSAVAIDNKNFDSSKLQAAKLLLVNTNDVGHACTKKAVNLAEAAGIRILYTSKYNLNSMAEELLAKL